MSNKILKEHPEIIGDCLYCKFYNMETDFCEIESSDCNWSFDKESYLKMENSIMMKLEKV